MKRKIGVIGILCVLFLLGACQAKKKELAAIEGNWYSEEWKTNLKVTVEEQDQLKLKLGDQKEDTALLKEKDKKTYTFTSKEKSLIYTFKVVTKNKITFGYHTTQKGAVGATNQVVFTRSANKK